ncbi:hypothetical protein GH810_08385 [Acetobacterium paludosum]|uniref:5-bromo-4-chloroindolyl phosphate hydrolysis protein n=1 Tax=Acetobacterium paludosum TaxID=52693 RepID=A0A923HYG2_9FIRM|nr:5-bromo-4-chloroindolyl phosphate hydrolysis family protein [Acetobacterium paludosum]MBC3888326.1 hypothetical protein [Acetobacterium paludosum]
MGKKEYSNIGDDIKDIIQDALSSTDFKKLNQNITETVNRALEEVKKSTRNWNEGKDYSKQYKNINNKSKTYDRPMEFTDYETVETKELKQNKTVEKQNNYRSIANKKTNLITKSPHGRISGMLLIVFGSIGMGLAIVFSLAVLILANVIHASMGSLEVSLGTLLFILALCIGMVAKGSSLRGRVKRFRQYVQRLKDHPFCEIKELAEPLGRNSKYVVKDLKKMIQVGMFLQGHIDEDGLYLLISDEAYEANRKMKEGKRLQDEEQKRQEEVQRQRVIDRSNPDMKAVQDVIDEGQQTIRQIRKANNDIPGEAISNKLDRLEIVITKIFVYIEENPKEVPEIRKFMNYYLPTTLKLVKVYQDMDAEPIQGANIMATKKEIEETMDTINHAFENLLDGFYEDTALDVSTDISVLNTMLAQEGLTKKDFE